ncbi:outer spore coat protein CotE [Phosphitispora sp. TUW77]|uniref:outer spore coat protein CotE n=1 Tax=Phosphitispora sp. TUW77 TaxID=3152361 RepID=UPI003AB6415A
MTTDRLMVREIITKAVCGKGINKYLRSIDLEIPIRHKTIQVLGNFVSNSAIDEATVVDKPFQGKTVQVKGHYDVHVWYAYDQETCAAKNTVTFMEFIPLDILGKKIISNQQASAKIIEKPRCRKAYVKNLGERTIIRLEIEQLLAAELLGLTKVKVGVLPKATGSSETIRGQELISPCSAEENSMSPVQNYYFDLKYDEDLSEDDPDYDY